MSIRKNIWNTKDNVEAYDRYARNYPMYQNTSNDLVVFADIRPGSTIVDLAAGTGATSEAILFHINNEGQIFAVDQAAEMINKAKENLAEYKNINFIVAAAEDLSSSITAPADVVLCNSAFWQMNPRPTLKSVANILKEEGVFAFNMPDQYFIHSDFHKKTKSAAAYNTESLINWAREAGLELEKEEIKEYSKSIEEVAAFNQIPIMAANFKTPGEIEQLIKILREREARGERKNSQWAYFLFRKMKKD